MFSALKLRELRKKNGYTQKALGLAIGTSERRVQFWEAANVEPSASYLLKIIILFNCNAQDLYEENTIKNQN